MRDETAPLLAAPHRITDEDLSPPWMPVETHCGLTLWQVAGHLPRIHAVGDVVVVDASREASLEAVLEPGFDPHSQAVVSGDDPPVDLDGEPVTYTVDVQAYNANELTFEIATSRPAMVVVAEPYYPGWKAAVDGEDAPIYRVNHAMRGIVVEEGSHQISLLYDPAPYRYGLFVSIGFLLLLVVVAVIHLGRKMRLRGEAVDG